MKRKGVTEAVEGREEGICDENKRASWGESEKEEEGEERGKVKRRRGLRETDSVGDRGRTAIRGCGMMERGGI